jgi:hypothetical protein
VCERTRFAPGQVFVKTLPSLTLRVPRCGRYGTPRVSKGSGQALPVTVRLRLYNEGARRDSYLEAACVFEISLL